MPVAQNQLEYCTAFRKWFANLKETEPELIQVASSMRMHTETSLFLQNWKILTV